MDIEPKDRCHAVTGVGQCNYASIPGTKFCAGHAGRHHFTALLKKEQTVYALTRYGERAKDLITVGKAHKSLHEEVALLRLTLEKTINRTETDDMLIAAAPTLGDLVMKIKATLESAHKLDQDEKRLLSKDKIVAMATGILDIICEYVTDPTLREEIAGKIAILVEEDAPEKPQS